MEPAWWGMREKYQTTAAGREPGDTVVGRNTEPAWGLWQGTKKCFAPWQKARPHLPTRSSYESPWAHLPTTMTTHQLGAAQGPIMALSGLLLLNRRQGHTVGQGQGASGGGQSWPWVRRQGCRAASLQGALLWGMGISVRPLDEPAQLRAIHSVTPLEPTSAMWQEPGTFQSCLLQWVDRLKR